MDADRDPILMNPLATQAGRDGERTWIKDHPHSHLTPKDTNLALDGLDILEMVMRALEVVNWMHGHHISQAEYEYWMTAWDALDQARARYAEWQKA